MHKQGVEFFEGVPTHDDLKKWLGDQQGGILVLDDLMLEGGDDKDILNLFTQHSHHLNVTVFYLICFLRENMPRPFREMPNTSSSSKILETMWPCARY